MKKELLEFFKKIFSIQFLWTFIVIYSLRVVSFLFIIFQLISLCILFVIFKKYNNKILQDAVSIFMAVSGVSAIFVLKDSNFMIWLINFMVVYFS